MTLANQLTLARGALGLAVFACLWTRRPSYYAAGLALYATATATDWVDGYVARRTRSISAFGAVADPLADKVLVLGALLAALRVRDLDIPIWAIFLLVVRELVMGGMRVLAGAQGRVLAAERWGKWKMGIQSACVLGILLFLVLRDTLLLGLPPWTARLPSLLVLLSLSASWASAILYLRQNRQLLRQSWDQPEPR